MPCLETVALTARSAHKSATRQAAHVMHTHIEWYSVYNAYGRDDGECELAAFGAVAIVWQNFAALL